MRRDCLLLFSFLLSMIAAPVSAQMIEFTGDIGAFDPPAFEASDLEQVIGSDETAPLSAFNETDYFRKLALPIGRLAIELNSGRSAYCTAALVRRDLILTNAHCVVDGDGAPTARRAILQLGYLRASNPAGTETFDVNVTSPAEVGSPGAEGAPDYALLRLASGQSADGWGTITLSQTPPVANASLVIVHHPGGFPAVVSAGGNCRANTTTEVDVFHICDTAGGSSGAPVFMLGTDRVIALHYRKVGLSENAAVRIDTVLQHSTILSGERRRIRQAALGEFRERLAAAILLRDSEQYAEAEAAFLALQDFTIKKIGDASEEHAQLLNHFGSVYWGLRDHRRRVEIFEQATRIYRDLKGPDSLRAYENEANMAGAFLSIDTQKSREIAERIIATLDENRNNGFALVQSHQIIGASHWRDGAPADAVGHFETAQSLADRFLPANHHLAIDIHVERGFLYGALGRCSDAKAAYENGLAALESSGRRARENHRLAQSRLAELRC